MISSYLSISVISVNTSADVRYPYLSLSEYKAIIRGTTFLSNISTGHVQYIQVADNLRHMSDVGDCTAITGFLSMYTLKASLNVFIVIYFSPFVILIINAPSLQSNDNLSSYDNNIT